LYDERYCTNGITIAITTTPIKHLRDGRLHTESNAPEIARSQKEPQGWLPNIQPALGEERRGTNRPPTDWTLGLDGRITDNH